MVVSGVGDSGPLAVYLFADADGQGPSRSARREWERVALGGSLTAREIEVLRYLALGWDVANIATELGLSAHTVHNHSTNLRRKLDVRSSLEAVMVATRLGVLKFDEGQPETGGS